MRCRTQREKKSDKHRGIYVGETARTLSEHAGEHRAGYRRMEFSNFMFKHWSNAHGDLSDPPEFKFTVVKKHPDPMGRLIHESVKILKIPTLNSKNEWGGGSKYPDFQFNLLTRRFERA